MLDEFPLQKIPNSSEHGSKNVDDTDEENTSALDVPAEISCSDKSLVKLSTTIASKIGRDIAREDAIAMLHDMSPMEAQVPPDEENALPEVVSTLISDWKGLLW